MIQDSITKKPEAHLYKKWFEKAEKITNTFLDYSDACLSKQQKIV